MAELRWKYIGPKGGNKPKPGHTVLVSIKGWGTVQRGYLLDNGCWVASAGYGMYGLGDAYAWCELPPKPPEPPQ